MALKMNAQSQTLQDLLVVGVGGEGNKQEDDEMFGGITPPHSDTLSPPHSNPPSPEDHVYITDVSKFYLHLYMIMLLLSRLLFCERN